MGSFIKQPNAYMALSGDYSTCMHVILHTRPSQFSACNSETLEMGLGTRLGYNQFQIHVHVQHNEQPPPPSTSQHTWHGKQSMGTAPQLHNMQRLNRFSWMLIPTMNSEVVYRHASAETPNTINSTLTIVNTTMNLVCLLSNFSSNNFKAMPSPATCWNIIMQWMR